MRIQRFRPYLLSAVYCCAAYQFLRYYVTAPYFYLNLTKYLTGRERLPFQFRILPIFILKPLLFSSTVQKIAAWRVGPLHYPSRVCFFLLACISFAVLYYFTHKLYRAVSETRLLEPFLFPVLLFVLNWTYIIHIEQDFSYPYDLPSLAFFTAGLYFIYKRSYWPLFAVMLIGTFNRETTLFLIGIYVLDMASNPAAGTETRLRDRFDLRQVPWLRVALMAAVWVGIKAALAYAFRGNDRSEDYNRLHENLVRLATPYYWPAVLSSAGFLIPFLLLLRGRLRPIRFGNYLYILVPWVVVMFFTGIILETRVYGELSCYLAICTVLIAERSIEEFRESRTTRFHRAPEPISGAIAILETPVRETPPVRLPSIAARSAHPALLANHAESLQS